MAMADDARIAVLAAAQQGVFTRPQALAAGFRAGQIERRVRAGLWCRIFPRTYRHAGTPESSATRHAAAALWCGPPSALSHLSAAAIWHMHDDPVPRPELVVPRARAPRVDGVVVHRVARLDDEDLTSVRGLIVTTPVRTIVDLAAVLGPDDLDRVLARACARRAVTVRAVLGRLDAVGSAGRPGASLLRALLAPIGSVRVDRSVRMAG
jgi:predicted transcriptional regulator of viral defense system